MNQINDRTKIWADINKIEQSAMVQIQAISEHPRLFKHVAIMPDVHCGIGATIGSVIPLTDAVIPSAVGVDAGCGMCAVKTDIVLRDKEFLDSVYRGIIENIPVGYRHRNNNQLAIVHDIVPQAFLNIIHQYENESIWNQNKIVNQIGTLGGGNHFIELQCDEDGCVWIMIHSGSRNIGNKITTTYIKEAKKLANASPDLEYFEADSEIGQEYISHVKFATDFAFYNRMIMMEDVKRQIRRALEYYEIKYGKPITESIFGPMINIHHNYVQKENHFGEDVWVHRKGATRVTPSIIGIIPGSMGTSSYIVSGTGNADSFNSCSHGAGRSMSRTAARGKVKFKTGEFKSEGALSLEDFKKDMDGVVTHVVDRQHLDEAPRAYKNIDEVMANQTDLVNIQVKLKPILNVKG